MDSRADYGVIDADGHVIEALAQLGEHLETRWRRSPLFPGDEWDRYMRGQLHVRKEHDGPHHHLEMMKRDQIDSMILFPSNGMRMGGIHEPDYATALARAYNDWLAKFHEAHPKKLHAMALVAPQEPAAAAEELNRAVTKYGAVGVFLPTHVKQSPDWGHKMWDPIYAEAERLGVPIGFHTTTTADSLGAERFRRYISAHTVDHPAEQMITLTATIIGGVFERFPKLRVGFMESGVGWVPYLMDRLDEEFEKRGFEEVTHLTHEPSAYIKSGRIFFGVECEEKTIADAVRWGLEDTLLYSSDYPHWDYDEHSVDVIRKRDDLSEAVRRKILHDNAVRFYGPTVVASG